MTFYWMLAAALVAASSPLSGATATNAASARLPATPLFRTLGVADGLPSDHIYKIVEDKHGFVWIGTHDGLARYDGVGVQVWQHDAADADSIASNEVQAVFVDRDNRIWCGGGDGLSVFDRRNGNSTRFAHYRHVAGDAGSLSTNDIWAIAGDGDGSLWVGGYGGGLDHLDPSRGTIAHWHKQAGEANTLASEHVLALTFDAAGRLWIGSDVGIDVRLRDASVRHIDLSAIASDQRFNATGLYADRDGSMLAATRHGLVRIDSDFHASVVANDRLSDPVSYAALRDDAGDLWIGTRHGLDRLAGDGQLSVYRENIAVPGSFSGDTVFDVMRDHEGGVWFATFEAGVLRLPPQWRNFSLYRNDPTNPSSLGSNRVHGLALDADGALWAVNSNGGIDRIDSATGRTDHLDAQLPTPDKALWSVLPDRNGQLWLGHSRGLRVYSLLSKKFEDLPVDAAKGDALAPGMVQQLAQSPSGAIWANSFGSAMQRIDPITHRVERFDEANADLHDAEVDQIGFDRDGNVVIADGAGLQRFDAASHHFVTVDGTPSSRVMAFAWGADGALWLHRPGVLERYRQNAGTWQVSDRLDARSGWPALSVGGMQVDAGGRVWVSSARGLWRYDPTTRSIRQFGLHDGLASAEFSRMPLIRARDGSVFGSTLAGVVGFDPVRVADNPVPPALVLDAIRVRRGDRVVELATDAARLALAWDARDLRIRADALSWANSDGNRYQWQMSGVDRAWIDSGNRGEREYLQLPPGSHELRIRAANASGVWSELPPLRIDQDAPPWLSLWAYFGYGVMALALLVWSLRAYRRRLNRRYALSLAEQKRAFAEQASAAKSEFLATMGHEIRTPMTGVLGMAELLLHTPLADKQRGYAEAILTSGQMMLRMVNDSLDLARIEAGKLELDVDTLDIHAVFDEVAALAAPIALGKGLQFEAQVDSDAPRYVRGDGLRIKQIYLNLVNNALKFTEHGAVSMTLARAAHGAVLFRVRDSGPGIANATRERLFQRYAQAQGMQRRHGGSGLGLAICAELVARMGGQIGVDSREGEGSTFHVLLPLAEAEVVAAPTASRAPAAMDACAQRLRVLLVEDDAMVAAVLGGQLETLGHHVRRVDNGLAALAEVDTVPYDVLLLDLDLPAVDGLAVARMLRARESTTASTRLHLIGISARSNGDEDALCAEAGMDAFLRKPILADALRACLASVCGET